MTPEEQREEFRWLLNTAASGIRFARMYLVVTGFALFILLFAFAFMFTSGGWLGWALLAFIGVAAVSGFKRPKG